MSDTPARRFHATLTGLRSGRITADQARAQNAALRADIGPAAYEAAKRTALANLARS
jgi:hypothetical protein